MNGVPYEGRPKLRLTIVKGVNPESSLSEKGAPGSLLVGDDGVGCDGIESRLFDTEEQLRAFVRRRQGGVTADRLNLLRDIKALWDVAGLGDPDVSEPLYDRLTAPIKQLSGK